MVAWKQPPATALTAHPGYSLDDRSVLRTFGVEDVAGNDDVLCPVFDRCAPKCVDCLEPRLAKAGPDFGLEAPIRFAELPVSRMDEFQNTSPRSEEHTSELQSLMRISYAVFCLKKKNKKTTIDKELRTLSRNNNDKLKQ